VKTHLHAIGEKTCGVRGKAHRNMKTSTKNTTFGSNVLIGKENGAEKTFRERKEREKTKGGVVRHNGKAKKKAVIDGLLKAAVEVIHKLGREAK